MTRVEVVVTTLAMMTKVVEIEEAAVPHVAEAAAAEAAAAETEAADQAEAAEDHLSFRRASLLASSHSG